MTLAYFFTENVKASQGISDRLPFLRTALVIGLKLLYARVDCGLRRLYQSGQ
jgi:hypothetical protein